MEIIRKKDDLIIGYVDDIFRYALGMRRFYGDGDDAVLLIDAIKRFDGDDLVKCQYHPMGSWYIVKLEEVHND